VNRRSVFIREQASVRSCGATTGGEANFRTGVGSVRRDTRRDMSYRGQNTTELGQVIALLLQRQDRPRRNTSAISWRD
jgi:hypothetical protein